MQTDARFRSAVLRIRRAAYAILVPRDRVFCFFNGLAWQPSWRLYGLPIVKQAKKGSIVIGSEWTACSKASHNSIGVFQPVILRVSTRHGFIRLGRKVGMSGCSISARVGIEMGDEVLIGSGALIVDSDAHAIHPDDRFDASCIRAAPVRIGSRVFVGARSIILKGVTIGEGAVVGAGAVVASDVAPFAIVVGNPARVVGDSRNARDVSKCLPLG